MATIIGEGITFDDVLLVPQYSEVLPNSVDTTTYECRNGHSYRVQNGNFNGKTGWYWCYPQEHVY